jgi:GT2 family glycosyltransferase
VQEAGQRLLSTGATTPIRIAPDRLTTVDYASGACWVMTARMHERLGGFDPLYHPAYFEDVDLALRARSMGLRCVVEPEVRAVHLGGQGTPDEIRPASTQRDILLDRWPDLRWRQPRT